MTPQEAKTYLMQYRAIIQKIKERKEQIAELRKVTAGLPYDECYTEAVEKMAILRGELSREIMELCETNDSIIRTINSVPNSEQQNVLYSRYVLGKTLEQIAVDMSYHYVSICRIHGRALAYVANLL